MVLVFWLCTLKLLLFSDISNAMLNLKMSSDTSYKQQYDQKELTRVKKFSFADGKI